MSPAALLEQLPPFQFERDIKVKKQTTGNIIAQVLQSHLQHRADYDMIAEEFDRGNAPKKIFKWCQQNLPYREESGEDQTTRSPAGMLLLADSIGVDCKHYANFAAGILDALNRRGENYDWCYRFVSYSKKRDPDHVYVVIRDQDVWIDPAPLKDEHGNYFERSFNDRYALPTFYQDLKPGDMLSHLSGVHYFIQEEQGNGDASCGGFTFPDFEPVYAQTKASVNTVLDTAGQLVGTLVEDDSGGGGGLIGFLSGLVEKATEALVNLIKGKKYTWGDYILGEFFMRNILGMFEIQSRRQVPDAYVPLAWQFFTTALGVEIGASDHLDQLVKSADAYYEWMPPEVDNATPRANAERAHRILKRMNFGAGIRDITWNLAWFAAEPYIYPIPDVTPGQLFTGIHPITGLEIVQGYPVQAEPEPVDPIPMDDAANAGDGTQAPSDQDTTPPAPAPSPGPGSVKAAGMNWLGIAIVAGGLVALATGMGKKKK